jgi:hypothetical protein
MAQRLYDAALLALTTGTPAARNLKSIFIEGTILTLKTSPKLTDLLANGQRNAWARRKHLEKQGIKAVKS